MRIQTISFPISNVVPSGPSRVTVQTRILAKNGEWVVPPAERPPGWEKLGLLEPLTNEERISALVRVQAMNTREVRQWFRTHFEIEQSQRNNRRSDYGNPKIRYRTASSR